MASLIEKVNTLISANLHYMVDQALEVELDRSHQPVHSRG